jgi:NAD(P)-dependent dehydrogenase (short-subunit alcohol dehydrogenase family)
MSQQRLEGQVALVTGGASGIGEGIVRRFVEQGARVLVVDVQPERGRALVDELGSDVTAFAQADVAVEADVEAAVATAVSRFGRLDCMVNNAGILGAIGPVADIGYDAWHRTIDVLLSSVFLGIKHAARVMIPQGGGNIISTASTAGVRAGLGPHVYTAAKHGVVGLCQSVATELGPHGIRVNVIAPGGTVSALTSHLVTGDHTALERAGSLIGANNPLRRAGMPRDIANAALFLASEEASFVNGAVLVVDAAGEAIGDRTGRFVQMGSQIVQEAGRTGM